VPTFFQPFTALPEGQAPRVFEPEASSGLLQVSPPYPRGRLHRSRMFIMSRLVCDYVHRIVLQFYVYFSIFLPSCGQLIFLYPASCLSCATLSQADLLEVPASYLGSFGYFLAQGPVLPNDYPSKKLMLMGGPECAAYLA
jgi:hypothetical protein